MIIYSLFTFQKNHLFSLGIEIVIYYFILCIISKYYNLLHYSNEGIFKTYILLFLLFVNVVHSQENINQSKLDSLINRLDLIDSVNNKIDWGIYCLEIGNTYYNNGNYDDGRTYYELLNDFSNRHQLTELNNKSRIYYSRILYIDSQYDQAINNFNEIIPILSLNDLKLKALALNFLGKCLVYTGNYSKAYEKQIEALKIYKNLKDEDSIAGIYYEIGNNYFYQGQLELSLQNFKKPILSTKS